MLLIGLAELEKRSRSSSTVSNVRMNCSGFVCCKCHRAGGVPRDRQRRGGLTERARYQFDPPPQEPKLEAAGPRPFNPSSLARRQLGVSPAGTATGSSGPSQ